MAEKKKEFDGDIFDNPLLVKARNRVILALEQGPEVLTKRFNPKLNLLRLCGAYPAVLITKDGRVVRVLRNRCRCRGCPVCETLGFGDVHKLLELVANERDAAGAKFSLITLTMPHKATDLCQKLVCQMFAAVGHFQRSPAFRKHVFGWARGIEIPWSKENGYHVHVHYIVEARLWPKEDLKRQWTASMLAVGGPYVPPNGAHVMGIKNVGKGILEAIGYPFKVQDLATMPTPELCQLLFATRGRHLIQMCRKWSRRAAQLEAEREAIEAGLALADGSESISFIEKYADVKAGDREAFELLLEAGQVLQAQGVKSVATTVFAFLAVEAQRHGWTPWGDFE